MTEKNLTIRGHLEAIRDRHSLENVGSDSHLCIWCGSSDYPCHDREDAVAALHDLDNAKIVADVEGIKRIVPDDPTDPVAAATPPTIHGHSTGVNAPPLRNQHGRTEDEIAERYEAQRAQENENRHAVVVKLDPPSGT